MRIVPTTIAGCFEIFLPVVSDERGRFVKVFHAGIFSEHGLQTHFAEAYYSVSQRRVLRGLHFQIPPFDHDKLVSCVSGEVIDVVVDLRAGSETYGEHASFALTANERNALYVPSGLAHGFYVLSESATLLYNVSTVYSAQHDRGILWSSVGIRWPDDDPVVSPRDRAFPVLSEFATPFRMRR